MTDQPLANVPLLCSWSGGKDSCLALYHAIQAGARPLALLNMLQEDGRHSRSHGLHVEILQAQARSLNLPLTTRATSWDNYEETFIAALRDLAAGGIQAAVFGDIDIDHHREWEEKVCAAAELTPHLPLWQRDRRELLEEFLGLGFRATIVACNDEQMGNRYLGRTLDASLIDEFERIGIDPCGEKGEYHTVVTDGPLFDHPIQFQPGEFSQHSGYWFAGLMPG